MCKAYTSEGQCQEKIPTTLVETLAKKMDMDWEEGWCIFHFFNPRRDPLGRFRPAQAPFNISLSAAKSKWIFK